MNPRRTLEIAALVLIGGLAIAVNAKCADVTVSITDQGATALKTVVGQTPPAYTILDATACNETDTDANIDNATIYERINTRTTQPLQLIDSQIVVRVLAVFQDRGIYAKLFRGGQAGITIGALLVNAFKSSPWGQALALGATLIPGIYEAVLPVVHSQQDLSDLAADILPQSQGGKMAAHSCKASIVVAHFTVPIKTELITVQ